MVSLMRSSVTRTRECSAVPLLQPTMLAILAFFLFLLLSEQKKSPQQRGVFEFLRGKILDVFPDYHKEAEDHLSKAVCSRD